MTSESPINLRRRFARARRIPDHEAWVRLPAPAQSALAAALLEEYIDTIGSEGREPDNWESLELRCAIDAFEQELYASMLAFISHALGPIADRMSFLGFRRDTVASLNDLRSAFAEVRRTAH